jgi:beta-lactamase class C
VALRRLFLIVLVVLGLVGLLWAAAVRFSEPVGRAPRAGGRFEIPVGEAPSAQPSRIDYARLDGRLTRLMEDPAMVGLAVAVVENGEIRFAKGYGVTAEGGEPITTSTIFRWASLSKGVAGDMVALLAAENRLSLYEPVARHAPSLRLPGGTEQVATVSDLLSHRLGLFSHAYDSKLEDGDDPRMLRASLAGLHNICPPGSCHAYQNVAFDAAAEIVERITGKSYAEAVQERLFAPLGMTTASFGREALYRAPSWARPHRGGRGSTPIEVTEPYYRVPAAGGVNGSIGDLAVWMLGQMGEAPDILPAAVLDAVQSPRAATPGETGRRRKYRERIGSTAYGLGWRILDYAGHRVVGHHGGVSGYRSAILFDPRLKAGVVLLWNSSARRPNGLEYEVMDMIYGLPFRDWLELDELEALAQPPGAEAPGNMAEPAPAD